MVTNNKVLTVSYGTFSCTLEGFDDSFDTMKAIAEYFRDLAADDRYFGAEPPTPDAEMLTRIAEREIERRVQARHEAGAIVLSAAPSVTEDKPETETSVDPVATQAIAEPAETPAAEAPTEESVEATEGLPMQEQPLDVVAEAVEETTEVITEADTEASVADLVAQVSTQDEDDIEVASETDEIEMEAALDVAEDENADIVEEASVEESAAEFFAASEASTEESDAGFEQEEAEDTVNLFEDAFAEAEEEDAPEEDSIAAKLRRIRAVVSRAESTEDDDEGYTEDQHADVEAPIDLDLSDDAAPAEASDDIAEKAEEIDAIEEAPKPRARVIRMKRSEFEDAINDGVLDEAPEVEETAAAPEEDAFVAEAAETETAEPIASDSSLSDEDEADLMAELAMVDAELAETGEAVISDVDAVSEVEAEPQDDIEDASVEAAPIIDDGASKRKKRRERRAKLDAVQPGEEAVDRLIEEANTKLDEPEGNRRRSAIAHLRAAVAATKAEKAAGKSFEKEDHSDAYRDDLADAVRPRKAAKSAPPLKLVAEQRIDTAKEDQPAGIRPRRVSVDDLAAVEANAASSNFVEFAENMGATQLPDVLEAAASYLTFVEGRKKFSRPMLMRLAYQVGDERFEREAGLRSFGMLLREKKIEKIAGGRFTVSEAINFKPDDREAG